ncbi:MAG: restriction endonuclease [Alphaproteobacteria bacterium]|nr:restriction endonuclease [Alphaproteobacteria bacterium]MBV9372723.1 restriction endonuclease [Alphaproteobacteria bacterium]MBV9900652.1 restriction endonuclease [Alphaproteobacteria bacterium]
MTAPHLVRTPLFPLHSDLKACVTAWDGESVQRVIDLHNALMELTGTPQAPVDWTEPDVWIPERLSGEHARLARKLWEGSGRRTNPRHVYGAYLLINSANLLAQENGTYRRTPRSEALLTDDPQLIRELDRSEGLPRILALLAEKASARRGDLLDDWGNYLAQVSKISSPSMIKDTLRRRLLNMVERGLVTRDGNRYAISEAGRAYLKSLGEQAPLAHQAAIGTTSTEIDAAAAIATHNKVARIALVKRLMALDPYAFEHFVKELLEAMDYENVQVTKQSGDKGVDVVANFQFGITEIKEVVQVKRSELTIRRPLIDQLRGALPYHGAIRGTLITLGRFAKGVEEAALYPGAAPITLIDGSRLVELVERHQVGLRRKPAYLLEIDEAFFAEKSLEYDPVGQVVSADD